MSNIKRCVSLYSYQDEYARGKMTLEDCLKELAAIGVEGVEIISDQMLWGAPDVSDEDIANWNRILRETGIKPICNDIYINTVLYRNRRLTRKENLDLLKKELRLAHKLGIHLVRLVSLTPTDIIEDALPLAEELDVVMALEVHGGMALGNGETKKFTDLMFKLNSPYVGLVIDTGIFCRKHPRVSTSFFLNQGLNPEVAAYIDNEFAKGKDVEAISHQRVLPEPLESLIRSHTDREYVLFAGGYENHDFSVLDEYLPFIKHFHGKFFEMTEEGTEYSIPYKELIDYLKAKGYDGYIASEYEGGRFALPGTEIDAVTQVRRHQDMLRSYI
ncbi:sugar phosphate isomerase/epimerase [Paenibacillus sp. NFR01]|uniref:sugar phosphate isomerase/epimerase family protein n=1 Tax=Paenibacillus sp. NFR01 TaxID=1566279 RepID=UPI0008AB90B7|nr:TIM barrel protein [Paenibacillus sp. NFR01]SET22473.1 Xylose isomerase-like TIM barrel [Paenibacillus sp. NFR01]